MILKRVKNMVIGSWNFSSADWGKETALECLHDLLDFALERGINAVDTAPAYGPELVEEEIGRFEHRKDLKISSKFGLGWADPYTPESVRVQLPASALELRKAILTSLEESLTRMQVDALDTFFLHHPPYQDISEEQQEGLSRLFEDLKSQGKVQRAGICNVVPNSHPRCWSLPWDVLQTEFNALKPWAEKKVFPEVMEGKEIWVISPLARGILSGNYSGEEIFDAQDHRSRVKWFRGKQFREICEKIREVQPLCSLYSCSYTALFLAWIYAVHPDFTIIAGAKNVSQFREALQARELRLREKDVQLISELFSENS